MKSYCTECKTECKDLENWGQTTLCPNCVEIMKKNHPNKTRRNPELSFFPQIWSGGAAYHPSLIKVLFFHIIEEETLRAVNHEYLHWVIHKTDGLKSTYQFDNVASEVDKYYS